MLILDDYVYNLSKELQNTRHFRCEVRTCPGCIVINHENEIPESHNHECEIKKGEATALLAKRSIMKSIKTKKDIFSEILTNTTCKLSMQSLQHLPSYESLRDYSSKSETKFTVTRQL